MSPNGVENLSREASVAPETQISSDICAAHEPGTNIGKCMLTPPNFNITASVETKRDVKDEPQISDKKLKNNPQEKLILSQKFKEFFNEFMDMVKNLFGLDSTNTEEFNLDVANLTEENLDEIEKAFPSIMDDSKGISDFQVSSFALLYDIKEDVARTCLEKFRKEERPNEPLIRYAIKQTNAIKYEETWELKKGEILSMCSGTGGDLSSALVDTSGLIRILAGYSESLKDEVKRSIIQSYFDREGKSLQLTYDGKINHDWIKEMKPGELQEFVHEMKFALRSIQYYKLKEPEKPEAVRDTEITSTSPISPSTPPNRAEEIEKLASEKGIEIDATTREMIQKAVLDDSKVISDSQVALFQKLFDIKDDKVARECLERFKAEQQDEPLILYAIEKTNSAISGTGNLVDDLTTEEAIQEALKKEGKLEGNIEKVFNDAYYERLNWHTQLHASPTPPSKPVSPEPKTEHPLTEEQKAKIAKEEENATSTPPSEPVSPNQPQSKQNLTEEQKAAAKKTAELFSTFAIGGVGRKP